MRERLGALGMGACSTAYSFYVLHTAIESYYHSNRASRGVGGCSAAERAYYVIIVSVVLSFLTVWSGKRVTL